MAKRYYVVVGDPVVAHNQLIKRYCARNEQVYGVSAMPKRLRDVARLKILEAVKQNQGAVKPKGFIHDRGPENKGFTFDCPDGLPNCRNCGDPDHAASCQAKGHCPNCGTLHGLVSERHMKENGYILVEVDQVDAAVPQ